MPSITHEGLLLLFRNRPPLAAELLRDVLKVELPQYSEARIESAELTDIQPAEYRADLVVLLYEGKPVLGIIVEVQLGRNAKKRFAWPYYAAGLRARIRCPVCLLVVTSEDSVARWASRPIETGGGNVFVPLVIGPSGVPQITDLEVARRDPELAVLSAIAHGRAANVERSLEVAAAAARASVGLDADRSGMYYDLIMAALSKAAGKAFKSMDPAKYEYQSEFAKRYLAKGLAKGKAEGKADMLRKVLRVRFGALPREIEKRVAAASLKEIDSLVERAVTAETLGAVFGPMHRARRK